MHDQKYLRALAAIPPFDRLNNELLHNPAATQPINHPIQFRRYEKGQLVHLPGEICEHLDVVLEGRVVVQKIDENGKVLTIQDFATRDLLGANLLFSSRNHYPMMVTAEQKTVLAQIDGQLLLNWCQQNADFMVGVLQVISDRAMLLTDKIQAISLKNIRQSLLDFLLYESQLQQSRKVRLPMSKKALAERMGIERTSLSRELNKMRQDGLVDFDARTITLK